MKAAPLIIALMFPLFCSGDEVRTVGGRDVNLQPLLDWLANRSGERPLKHWKEVSIKEWKRTLSSSQHCIIEVEGTEKEVLILNLPERLTMAFSSVLQLDARAQALEPGLNDVVPSGTGKSGKRLPAPASNATWHEYRQTTNALARARLSLNGISHKVLAMSIGGTYGGLPVWDCGKIK